MTPEFPASSNIVTPKMLIFYHSFNWLLAKPIEGLAYSRVLDLENLDTTWALGAVFVATRAYSGLTRRTVTKIMEQDSGIDTQRARILSLIPYGDLALTGIQALISAKRTLTTQQPIQETLAHFWTYQKKL